MKSDDPRRCITAAEAAEQDGGLQQSVAHNVALARRWLDAFNARDLDGLLSLYADDCEHTSPKIRLRHPATGGKISGHAALRAWWKDAFDRLPSLRYEFVSLTADEHAALLEYLRHVDGEPPMPIAEVFEVRDGRIARSRVYHG